MGDVQMDLKADRHRMRADAGRLLQVFWNLMNNAHKFTAAGKAIRIVSRNTENGLLRIEVADSGAGISAESLPKIFNAFEQGESPQARKTTGLGLGLAIAKALVEMHGGRIYAHSNGANTGATFAVELPVGDGSGADAETG
jgi:two-component system CheB/CheR fusion protein